VIYKKILNTVLSILAIFIVLEFAAVLSNKWYFEKISVVEVRKRELNLDAANAVKHAYAASLVHGFFRNIWMGKRVSRGVTIFFGELNEVAEVFFRPTKDSTLEMMKDMHNNIVGIYVSEWLETNEDKVKGRDRMTVIGDLAQNQILLLSGEDILLSDQEKAIDRRTTDFWVARNWFLLNKNDIVRKTDKFLLTY
jgi:hypothetical protein